MTDPKPLKFLFIGGSADGRWLEVEPSEVQHRVASETTVPNHAHGEPNIDPRPKRVSVVEVYDVINIKNSSGGEKAFVLNALKPDAVHPQVVKHFGREATYTKGV